MRISIFGLGYVGAVSCACLAKLGHDVIGVDVAQAKVDMINDGQSPIIETDLPEMIAEVVAAGKLSATTSATEAVANSDVALLCVGTPSTPSGGVNAVYLEAVIQEIGQAIKGSNHKFFTILSRSTSLPPVHDRLMELLAESSGRTIGETVGYVCHPEFLREGVAVADFYQPPKIVFGVATEDEQTLATCHNLYPGIEAPTFVMAARSAAMVKYADNCFHAIKVTFGNEIGMMARTMGIDSHEVMDVFCQDTKLNISPKYLKPGLAYGGSCLPKDLRAMLDMGRQQAVSLPMLEGMSDSNDVQVKELVKRIISPSRPTVGIVGLAFKEGTDDVRESPIVSVVEQLTGKGHPVKIYDAHLSLQSLVGANRSFALQSIPHLADLLTDDLQSVVDASDVLLVSHRLDDARWQGIHWPEAWNASETSDKKLIDLVNIPVLHDRPHYDGLYW